MPPKVDLSTIEPVYEKPPVPKGFSDEQLKIASESIYRTFRNHIISEVYNRGDLTRGTSNEVHKKNLDSYVKKLIPLVETSGGQDLSNATTETLYGIKPNTWTEMLQDTEELTSQLSKSHGSEFLTQINDWQKYVHHRGLKNAPKSVLEAMVLSHLWMSMGSSKTQPQAQKDVAGVMDGRESSGISLYMSSYYRGKPSQNEYKLAEANIRSKIRSTNWGSALDAPAAKKDVESATSAVVGAPQGKKANAAAYGDIGSPGPGITGAGMDSTYPVGE